MKKRLCFLAVFICFLFCTFPVRADLIWEPQDSFYENHASQCTYVNRCFTANGPEGTVTLYESPESAKVIDTWENGYEVYISHTYMDSKGILWGIYENREPRRTGWMPMDYMKVVYDYISFEEEYGSEIMEQSGVLEERYRDENVCLWDYPGAEESYDSMKPSEWPDLPKYASVYTDEKGHNWGYVGYYYGRRNFWICLDQPAADYEQLYPDGGPRIGEQAEDAETGMSDSVQGKEQIVPQQNHGVVLIVTVLAALVVLVTAALLVLLGKNKS